MPRNKDLKRLVRARMSKTGESYTAARAKVIARSTTERRTGSVADVRAASASPGAEGGLRCARRDGRRDHQGEDRLHVGPLGLRAGSLRRRQDVARRDRRAREHEIQDRRLVGAVGHRGVRAHQGSARHRSAAGRHLRGEQVPHVQRAGRRRCSRPGRMRASAGGGSTGGSARFARRPRRGRSASMARIAAS